MPIKLPKYNWFVSRHELRYVTNTYSGSLGTDPTIGCLSTRTFNYRAYVEMNGEKECEFRLIAESFIIPPWDIYNGKIDCQCAEFECSDAGIQKAEAWLAEIATKCGF